jgi:HTH-type transcriptional regulator / antitoxin MqsA
LGIYWPKLDADLYVPTLVKALLGTKEWMAPIGVMTAMRAFKQEVNASLADAGFIRETRAKLGLTQQAASRLFGGGNNGFSRYESGETKPTLALVQLFRLLERRPELLSEIIDNSNQSNATGDHAKPHTMDNLVQHGG